MGRPRPLFHLFSSFQPHITNFTSNRYVKRCPSSIRCWDLNSRPLEHESPPITTRPGIFYLPTHLNTYAWVPSGLKHCFEGIFYLSPYALVKVCKSSYFQIHPGSIPSKWNGFFRPKGWLNIAQKMFFVGWAISRCLSTIPHPIGGQGGSILFVHYSMIILKPAILIIMAVVRYNHTPIYRLPCCIRLQPGIITEYPIGR